MLTRLRTGASGPSAARRSDTDGEARLLRQIGDGDLRAFEELYRLYHPRLTRFLINMVGRRQFVQEVLHDTLMVVWGRPEGYSGESKVSTWIFAIAYRKALKALKRQDEPVEDRLADTRPSPEEGAERELSRRQVQAALMGAIADLSADHRAVVDLCYFHEMGYREIAEIMDCPVDTVKTRMFHARRHLKAKLVGPLADWL